MKVKELIRQLQEHDPELTVYICGATVADDSAVTTVSTQQLRFDDLGEENNLAVYLDYTQP